MRVRMLYALLAAAAFAVAITACDSSSEQVYGIGDVVDVGGDMTMTLAEAEFGDDRLEASFVIGNNGIEEGTYNLVLSLQARDTAGSPMAQIVPCGADLDGVVQPGEMATAGICWDTEGAQTVRIHYLVLVFDSEIVWEVEE